jgi:undecaprenyl-diphosphatase
MPDWLSVIILGLIEGLTEFIPVSSTGHLLIAEKWLGHKPDWFNVFIQVGAALALLPIFWAKLKGCMTTIAQPGSRDFLLKLGVAFVITGAGGVLLDKFNFELPKTVAPVAWATLIGAFVIWGIEGWRKNHAGHDVLTWGVAVACGLAQLLAAVFPGTSRSGATIMAALALGLARRHAAEFSFILGMITLTVAGVYKLLGAWRHDEIHGASAMDLTLGFVASAVSAFLVVKWLLRFVQRHTFNGFAVYRLILGAVLLLWFAD